MITQREFLDIVTQDGPDAQTRATLWQHRPEHGWIVLRYGCGRFGRGQSQYRWLAGVKAWWRMATTGRNDA